MPADRQPASSAASPRSTIVSTPSGFDVRDPSGKLIETIPFGRADDAWALAAKLDKEASRV